MNEGLSQDKAELIIHKEIAEKAKEIDEKLSSELEKSLKHLMPELAKTIAKEIKNENIKMISSAFGFDITDITECNKFRERLSRIDIFFERKERDSMLARDTLITASIRKSIGFIFSMIAGCGAIIYLFKDIITGVKQ